jgi:hypothetical protein
MNINHPNTLTEVRAAFDRYEAALISNDVATLDQLFWESPLVLRFGYNENLYGIEAIRAFRSARSASGLARTLANTVITTFGTDFATANTEFYRDNKEVCGRQSQTWIKLPEGWRVVSAHVSLIKLAP